GERRRLLGEAEQIRAERNVLADQLKQGKPEPEQIEKGKELKSKLAELESQLEPVETEYVTQLKTVPNVAFDDVPLGGEEDSVEIKVVGDKPTGAADHLDFAEKRGWVDFDRGAK